MTMPRQGVFLFTLPKQGSVSYDNAQTGVFLLTVPRGCFTLPKQGSVSYDNAQTGGVSFDSADTGECFL